MYKQILLVDDDIYLAYAIQSYISSKCIQLFVVSDSISAIELIKLYTFDLIISDIMMPNINGYEFLKKLRTDSRFFHVPFMFLTAKGMTVDRIRGYDLGCNAYLTKPFHPSELFSLVNNLLVISSNLEYSIKNYLKVKDIYDNRLSYDVNTLTCREISVLNLLVKGMMNKEIASILNMSKKNVEKYVSRLLNKTNTRNRTELARLHMSYLSFQQGE